MSQTCNVIHVMFWLNCLASLVHAQVGPPSGYELLYIAEDPLVLVQPRINDCGQIVYSKHLRTPSNGDVYRYDNGRTSQLTGSPMHEWWPDLNNRGQIAWSFYRFDGTGSAVVVREGQSQRIAFEYPDLVEPVSLSDTGQIAVTAIRNRDNCPYESDILRIEGESLVEIVSAGSRAHKAAPPSIERTPLCRCRLHFSCTIAARLIYCPRRVSRHSGLTS